MNDETLLANPPGASAPGAALPGATGRARWPPVAAVVLLLAIVGEMMHRAVVLNGGQMTYALDDAYAHMAIAKNLVRHGVWGLSALDGFSSSASSLLWPLLLAACDAVFGERQSTPLILNLAASAATLFYAASILRRFAIAGWRSFLILTAVIVLVPLPGIIIGGMEHSVQILITLAFVDVAAGLLADGPTAGSGARARNGSLLVLGCLMTGIRYEGLFLVGIVGLLLLLRRRWRLAVGLGVVAALPLVLFGWYSVLQGWYPLPNTILLKGNLNATLSATGLWTYLSAGLRRLRDNYHLFVVTLWLVAVLTVEWRRQRTLWTRETLLLAMTLGVLALHLQFADVGLLYRYEAYLMVLSLLVLGLWLAREFAGSHTAHGQPRPPRRAAWARVVVLVLVSCLVLCLRAGTVVRIPLACHNVYEQQYQMGRFMRRFYTGQGVAINDVGMVDYLADIHLFDTYGLANLDVMRAKRANGYDHTVVQRSMERSHVRVVAIYDDWATEQYGGPLPNWTPVGRWTLNDNVICACPTVSFYAPDPAQVPELTRHLQEFAPLLPASVKQTGLYRGDPAQHVMGTYNATLTEKAPFYLTAHAASFFIYPLAERGARAEQEAMLTLPVRPVGSNVRLELVVNEQTIGSKDFAASHLGTAWTVPVKFHDGMNSVRVIGQGTPLMNVNLGPLLFILGEPRWTLTGPADAAVATR